MSIMYVFATSNSNVRSCIQGPLNSMIPLGPVSQKSGRQLTCAHVYSVSLGVWPRTPQSYVLSCIWGSPSPLEPMILFTPVSQKSRRRLTCKYRSQVNLCVRPRTSQSHVSSCTRGSPRNLKPMISFGPVSQKSRLQACVLSELGRVDMMRGGG